MDAKEEAPLHDKLPRAFDDSEAHSDAFEQKMSQLMAVPDINHYAEVNKIPWGMVEEVKRRKGYVTVYTGMPAKASSERMSGRMGHSALRTYTGGVTGKGIYASFYPGDCNTNPRHPSCNNSRDHFHKWNQEERQAAVIVDLPELDVEAINSAFQAMHENMDSLKPWTARHNCSDVVLSLLESGEIFKRFNFKYPYGVFLPIIVGAATGFLLPPYIPILKNAFFSRQRQNVTYLQTLNDPIMSGVMSSLVAFPLAYGCSMLPYHRRKLLPFKIYQSTAIVNAVKAGAFAFIIPWIEVQIINWLKSREQSNTLVYKMLHGYGVDFIATPENYSKAAEWLWYLKEKISFPIAWPIGALHRQLWGRGFSLEMKNNADLAMEVITSPKSYFFQACIIMFGGIGVSLAAKYFLDTTTTPKQLLNLVKPIEKSNSSIGLEKKKEPLIKSRTLKLAVSVAAVGVFMYKNKQHISFFSGKERAAIAGQESPNLLVDVSGNFNYGGHRSSLQQCCSFKHLHTCLDVEGRSPLLRNSLRRTVLLSTKLFSHPA